MRKVMHTVLYIFSTSTRNIKFITAFLLITYALYIYVSPVELAAEFYDLNISYGLIGVVCSDSFVLLALSLAALFVFSDLPIDQPSPYFLLVRSGKLKWTLSHLLYVVIVSTLMLLITIAEIVLFSRGRLFIGNGWGKIITAVAEGQINNFFGITLEASTATLIEFSPSVAVTWSLSSLEATFMIIGCVSFILNLVIIKGTGVVVNGIVLFMHLFCGFFPTYLRYYFSPIDWCSIFCVDLTGYGGVPDMHYIWMARGMIFLLIFSIAVISSLKMKDFSRRIERRQT